MGNLALRIENVGKQYQIGQGKTAAYETLGDRIVSTVQAPFKRIGSVLRGQSSAVATDSIWALRDVSFEVQHGEVVGIIGRNGAGKSTLLKILSQITEPTKGSIDIYGRVGALLEVGTGFHPELTGRENVFLNGAILGMNRHEIARKFDEIVDFSGIEKFIDTPVKHYSSGMQMRLAFAVAAHLDPEILIVDEVLAVGDAEFQKKCLGKMSDVTKEGRTVLFVSHNMGAVQSLCTRGVVLSQGSVNFMGSVTEAVNTYLDALTDTTAAHQSFAPKPTQPIQIMEVKACAPDGSIPPSFAVGMPIEVRIRYVVREPLAGVNFALLVRYKGNDLFASFDTDANSERLGQRAAGVYEYRVPMPSEIFKAGIYAVGITLGVNRTKVESLSDCIAFLVEEMDENTAFKSYAEHRVGIVRIPLIWNEILL